MDMSVSLSRTVYVTSPVGIGVGKSAVAVGVGAAVAGIVATTVRPGVSVGGGAAVTVAVAVAGDCDVGVALAADAVVAGAGVATANAAPVRGGLERRHPTPATTMNSRAKPSTAARLLLPFTPRTSLPRAVPGSTQHARRPWASFYFTSGPDSEGGQ
jgi:hypothetical protein